MLVRWFLECRRSLLPSHLTSSNLPWFMGQTFQIPMQYFSLQHRTLLLSPVTSTAGYCFSLAPSLHSFWSSFSTDLQEHIGHLLTWGVPLSVSYHCAFSYCSWGSQCKRGFQYLQKRNVAVYILLWEPRPYPKPSLLFLLIICLSCLCIPSLP